MVSLPRYIYRKTSTKYRQIHHAWILWDSNRGVPDSPKSHGLQVLVLLPTAVSSRSAPLLVVPAVLIILRETHRGRDEVDIQYIYIYIPNHLSSSVESISLFPKMVPLILLMEEIRLTT